MKYVVIICTVLLFVAMALSPAQAGQYRYSFGGFGEIAQLSGGNLFSFDREASYGFTLGHRLGDQWRVGLRLSWLKFDSDTTFESDVVIDGLSSAVPATFEATRIGLQVSHLLLPGGSSLNFRLDGGGGLLVWDMFDSTGSNTFSVMGDKDGPTDFSASELFLSAGAGIEVRPAPQLTLGLDGHIDYLTGAGASFQQNPRQRTESLAYGGVGLFHPAFRLYRESARVALIGGLAGAGGTSASRGYQAA